MIIKSDTPKTIKKIHKDNFYVIEAYYYFKNFNKHILLIINLNWNDIWKSNRK
jgi:hypothetical protein